MGSVEKSFFEGITVTRQPPTQITEMFQTMCSAISKPTTEYTQPRLSRSLAVIPVFVTVLLVLPGREATNLGVLDLCHFALLKRGCANSGGFGAR